MLTVRRYCLLWAFPRGFKTGPLGKRVHTFVKGVSFSSPINVGLSQKLRFFIYFILFLWQHGAILRIEQIFETVHVEKPDRIMFFSIFFTSWSTWERGNGQWMDPQRVLILSQFLNLILFELHRGYVHIMSAGLIPHLIFSN